MICLLCPVTTDSFASDYVVTPEPVPVQTEEPQPVELPLSYGEDIQKIICKVAEEHNISETLLMAIAEIESGGNPHCVSSTNDYGLMQINKCNHKWISEETGVTDFLDARQSVEAACFIIEWLRETYPECEDVSHCMMAYNMGYGNASKLWNKGIHESKYSIKVLNKEAEISKIIDEGSK